jgi:hypothetical protein
MQKHHRASRRHLASAVLCVFFTVFGAYALYASEQTQDSPIYLPLVTKQGFLPAPGEPGYCLTAEETKLATLINAYRTSLGLPEVPLSRSLSSVAQWHVRDLEWNHPNSGSDPRGLPCNMHSWSDTGSWTPVCYTSDHLYADGMWFKPREITKGVYPTHGFEIAMGGDGWTATAAASLAAWQSSPPHNNVIIEQGPWVGYQWPAMGVGIYEGYAVVWFGRTIDPAGTLATCQP